MADAHTIPVTTHGRYLTERPRGACAGVLLGFHGYGEAAEAQLDRLRSIPGSDRWVLVAVQGLHRFYSRRSQDVVASWMTRQDRELAISDNLAYVARVVESVTGEAPSGQPLVFTGFSQGVAMAFRAACGSRVPVAGVIAAGGDVPPELDRADLARIPLALLARGNRDEWYTADTWTADYERLMQAGVETRRLAFEGGHEWHQEVSAAAGALLEHLTTARR